MDNQDDIDLARIKADLAFKNLAKLGRSCERAEQHREALVEDRRAAIVGVAAWGFSQRQLAAAARLSPQRIGQILAAADMGSRSVLLRSTTRRIPTEERR